MTRISFRYKLTNHVSARPFIYFLCTRWIKRENLLRRFWNISVDCIRKKEISNRKSIYDQEKLIAQKYEIEFHKIIQQSAPTSIIFDTGFLTSFFIKCIEFIYFQISNNFKIYKTTSRYFFESPVRFPNNILCDIPLQQARRFS